MATAIKRMLVGRALRTEQAIHERLTKKTALAVFSSDALSSTAYATEEILLVLAAAALLVDYVLTVSVSIAAGVAAITSAVQGTRYAWLDDHKVILCLIFIAFIAIANLRGVRESGALFAAPTYVFVVSFLFMIAFGLFHYFAYGAAAPLPGPEELKIAEGYKLQPLTLFLLLGAFSNGCAALTGIEAISNGVQAFKKPEAHNAP